MTRLATATRSLAAIVAVIVAVSVVAAACGDDSGSGEGPENTEVVLLTHSSFAVSDEVLDEFTDQTGYTVRLLQEGDAGVAVNQAILRKNNPVADALFGVDNTFLTRALDADIFASYEPAGSDQVPPDLAVDSRNRVTPIDRGNVCLNVDLSWFGQDGHPPPPESFDDLLDPRYRDLTVVENASTSSPGLAFLLATIAEKGDPGWQDYWQALRDNGVRVVDDWTQAYNSDFTAGGGTGDRPIVVSYGSSPPADVVFSEPPRDEPRVGVVEATCFRQVEYAGVLRGARNEEGAQALLDFMLSGAFQADMPLQMFVHPVIPDVEVDPVFAEFAVDPPEPLTLDVDTIGEHREEWIKEWNDIVIR